MAETGFIPILFGATMRIDPNDIINKKYNMLTVKKYDGFYALGTKGKGIFIFANVNAEESNLPIFLPKGGNDWDHENTASLDRIDSSKGYVKDNVQWVHKDINRMKWNFPQDKFVKLCSFVANKIMDEK